MGLQPAPSALRAVEIVRYLADHPGKAFSVTDLARRVGQSRATCHSVLLALEPANWVRRSEGGYTLGAGLISVGAAAQQGAAIVGLVRAAVRDLHQEVGCEVVGYLPAGDQLINVSRVGPTRPLSVTMVEGQTFPLSPPFGLAFVAWDDTELEKWIARAPNLGTRVQARLRKAAAAVRELGYSVILDPLARREVQLAINELSEARRQLVARAIDHDELLGFDRAAAGTLHASFLSAPVFGADGKVSALIGIVFGIDQYRRVPELAASLLAASGQLGDRLGARLPQSGREQPA